MEAAPGIHAQCQTRQYCECPRQRCVPAGMIGDHVTGATVAPPHCRADLLLFAAIGQERKYTPATPQPCSMHISLGHQAASADLRSHMCAQVNKPAVSTNSSAAPPSKPSASRQHGIAAFQVNPPQQPHLMKADTIRSRCSGRSCASSSLRPFDDEWSCRDTTKLKSGRCQRSGLCSSVLSQVVMLCRGAVVHRRTPGSKPT